MDAIGNLIVVVEPNPALTSTLPPSVPQTVAQLQSASSGGVSLYFVTTYGYDILNHLTNVTMPRPGVAQPQIRTFNYIPTGTSSPGAFLLSATNPENGTVTYTYSNGLLRSKTDAKNQTLTYQYDSYNRLSSVTLNNTGQVLRTFTYDYDSTGFSQNALGRLVAVSYPPLGPTNVGFTPQITLTDRYSYIAAGQPGAGLPAKKRLEADEILYWQNQFNQPQNSTVTVNLDASYAYNNEGKITSMTYPTTTSGGAGPTYYYSYDGGDRVNGMTDASSGNVMVNGVSCGPSNELLNIIFNWPGGYDPVGWNNASGYQISLYSPSGQKLGTYQIDVINPNGSLTLQSTLIASDLYFGGRRLAVQDRLGSVGNYYPYGEARGTNPQDNWSFATYWRDAGVSPNLDYADQRYDSNQFARFMTPDPYSAASAGPADPVSWNRYNYTRGDPVNRYDPLGLDDSEPSNGIISKPLPPDLLKQLNALDLLRFLLGSMPFTLPSIATPGSAGAKGKESDSDVPDKPGEKKSWLCGSQPDARIVNVNLAAGVIGSTGWNFDLIINYLSGEISLAVGTFLQIGWNGAGATVAGGYAWNLGADNHNIANINTIGYGQIPIGGVAASVAAGANAPSFGSVSVDPSKGFVVVAGITISFASIVNLLNAGGGSATLGVVDIGNLNSMLGTLTFRIDRVLAALQSACGN